ncbi:MAG: 16S rRNA (adenine(1518)-N(6)/adenine(1519)-N(6))-dimethyltransferase RsmA [bacterium]
MNLKKPKKHLGQHFLHDENYLRKIVKSASIGGDDFCLEIGAGTGNLTRHLGAAAGRVVAVEVDSGLAEQLRVKFPNVCVVEGSILKTDLAQLLSDVGAHGCAPLLHTAQITGTGTGAIKRWKVVANLPYYITTPIIFQLLENKRFFSGIYLLVQREVAERIVAAHGSKTYGALSIMCQIEAECRIGFKVPRTVFYPSPKVDSAFIELIPRAEPPFPIGNAEYFAAVVRCAFEHRRKTCYNSLCLGFSRGNYRDLLPKKTDPYELFAEILAEAGIKKEQRPETIPIENFARLAVLMQNKIDFQSNESR